VSELQLTAPANAGVQKAKSVCKSWRLSVSELHTYFVEKRYTESATDRVIQDLLRLPCSSGHNSFARKLICLGGRSNTVFERGKFVAPTVPAPSGRNSLPRKLICLSGRSEPPLFKSSFCNPIRQQQSLKTTRLLRLFSGVRSVIPIAASFVLPRKKPPCFLSIEAGKYYS
jgi:hypothetical protein